MDIQAIQQQLQNTLDELISSSDSSSQLRHISRMRTLLDALESSVSGSPLASATSNRKNRFSTKVKARTFDSDESSSGDPDNENEDSASESENDDDDSDDSGAAGSADESDEKKRPAKKSSVKKVPLTKKQSPAKKTKSVAPAIPAPKRPLSAYMIFCQEKRVQVKEENPQLSVVDVMKKLAETWTQMTDAEKNVFQSKASELKQEYEQAMREYEQKMSALSERTAPQPVSQLPMFSPAQKQGATSDDDDQNSDSDEEKKPRGRVVKTKRDPNAPKRNVTAYMYFANEMRDKIKAEIPDAPFSEIAKRVGQLWLEATPETKAIYEKKAAEDKVRYTLELENYKKAHNL